MALDNKNIIHTVGFLSTKFSRTFQGKTTAQLSISFNTAKSDEEAKWQYLNVAVESTVTDFKEFDNKRVSVTGYLSGDHFVPKGTDKEVSKLVIVVNEIKEVKKGEKAPKSSIILTSRVGYPKEFGENGAGAKLSVRFRKNEKENYRFVNIDLSGSRSRLPNLVEGEIITVQGFLIGNPYTPEGSEKEIVVPKIVGMEILERAMPSQEESPAQEENTPAQKETPAQEESPAQEEDDDDNIPF
jgi:hypothetical protein